MVDDQKEALVKIPAVLSNTNLFNIQKTLSINVSLIVVKRVGNVILGQRLYDDIVSKKSLYILFSLIFSKLMLKCPVIMDCKFISEMFNILVT